MHFYLFSCYQLLQTTPQEARSVCYGHTTYVDTDIMQVNTDIAHEMLSCTLLHISSIGRSSVMIGPTQYAICRFISRSTNFAWIVIYYTLKARIPCMLAGGQELTPFVCAGGGNQRTPTGIVHAHGWRCPVCIR